MPQPLLQLGLTSHGSFYILTPAAGGAFAQEGVQRAQDAQAPTGGGTTPKAGPAGEAQTTGGTTETTGGQGDPKQPQQQICGTEMLMMMGGMFLIVYFLMLRPQQKQEKARRAMLAELGKGSKIVTSSGIHCEIVAVHAEDGTVTVKFGNDAGQRMKMDRGAISRVQGDEPAPEKKG